MTINKCAAVLAGAAISIGLCANTALAGSVTIGDPWIRALPGKLPAGGYFTLHNGSTKTVTLTGAESPVCGMLMLHKSDTMSGMASMSDVASIDIPAGSSLEFAPGGYHLMCMEPSAALKPGASVAVTVQFADGTKLSAPFAVRSATGK